MNTQDMLQALKHRRACITGNALGKTWALMQAYEALVAETIERLAQPETRPSRLLGPAVDPWYRGCCSVCGLPFSDCRVREDTAAAIARGDCPLCGSKIFLSSGLYPFGTSFIGEWR